MKGAISYLNTDLDLFSAGDLTALAAALSAGGMGIHHVGEDEGSWRAHLDMDDQYATPELTIAAMLDIIERLPEALKAVWAGCRHREFNIGYDCWDGPRPLEQALSNALLGRIAAVGAGVGITLYPPRRTNPRARTAKVAHDTNLGQPSRGLTPVLSATHLSHASFGTGSRSLASR